MHSSRSGTFFNWISYFSKKTYVVLLIRNALSRCFCWEPTTYLHGEVRKICGYPFYLELCRFFHLKSTDIFLISPWKHMLWVLIRSTCVSMKTHVVGTHQKCLTEALLMSTHNICFHGDIRKLLCGYPLLFGAMLIWWSTTSVMIDMKKCCLLQVPKSARSKFFTLIVCCNQLYWRFETACC